MAIQNGFFKSINGDRRYLAEFFTSYFASFIGNGVFPNPSTNLQVINNQNFSTIVRPGKGWINGHYLNNDDNIVINHQPPDGVLRRIDRIVFAVNLDSRSMDIYLKQGTPSSSPTAPSLIRNSTLYELALADIAFNPGAVSISQSNITDQRMNRALCGIVHGVVEQLDTTTLFNQYQQFLIDKGVEFDQQLAVNQQIFDDWFAQLNDILDGDVAANLANMIITHTNNLTSQKHIEVVNVIPSNLANKGLLLQIDDLDNPDNAPEIPTSMVLNQRIDSVSQQFTREINEVEIKKADKVYVDGLISGISDASPRDIFYSIAALNARFPNGESGTYLVFDTSFADGAHAFIYSESENLWKDLGLYQANGIGYRTVTPQKTTFVTTGKNLFNKYEAILDKSVNSNNGNLINGAGYFVGVIDVLGGLPYRISKKTNEARAGWVFSFYAWYDQNDVYISGGQHTTSGSSITSPSNARILRFTSTTIRLDEELQVEQNTVFTEYEDFIYEFVYKKNIDLDEVNSRISTLEDKTNTLEETVPILEQSIANEYSLVLPSKIPALVGREMFIYYDNIFKNGNAYKVERFNISGGTQYEDRVRFIPNTGASQSNIVADVYTNGKILKSKTSQLVPVPTSNGAGTTKRVLIIGDSLTDNPHVVPELTNLFNSDAMNVDFLGTRGTAPNNHEARSGWSAYDFCNLASSGGVANPFYNTATSTFDFAYYMAQQGYTGVDIVLINLGTNDLSETYPYNQIDNIMPSFENMVSSIRAYNSNVKIILGLPIIPSRWFVGWGESYKTRLLNLVDRFITDYDNRENEKIYLSPLYLNIDPYWDFRHNLEARSARNPETAYVGSDVIHPTNIGYYKMADVNYNMIKYVSI